MSLDYLVPVLVGAIMLTGPAFLLAVAWWRRPAVAPPRSIKAHHYRPGRRQAYSLSRSRVQACLSVSLFAAAVAGLGMARWLPLSPADSALLATLAAPLLWAAGLVFLLTRKRWRRACAVTLVLAAVALCFELVPLVTG